MSRCSFSIIFRHVVRSRSKLSSVSMWRLYQNISSAGSGSSGSTIVVCAVVCVVVFFELLVRSRESWDRGSAGGPDIGECALLESSEPRRERRLGEAAKYGEEFDRGGCDGAVVGVWLLVKLLSRLTPEYRASFAVGIKAALSSLRVGMVDCGQVMLMSP